ncbi:MAG: acyl-CoA dehydrogenase family protein, partial [Pseudomonadota bacterium]
MIHNDDLLQNAERLRQSFAEQAEAMETARRIPADVSSAMAKAGFYRMFVPKEFGGLETPPAIASRVFEALARGNASCAWVSFIGATSGSALARIEDTQAREIFATPETMIAGVFAPNGKAERVADGFQVSGRWQWGSGTQNADWILGGSPLSVNRQP